MSRIERRQVRTSDDVFELVTLATMKEYLLEAGSSRDTTISNLISAASLFIEEELGYIITTDEEIEQYFDEFDSEMFIFHRYITDEIVVEYLLEGVWTAVSDDVYALDRADIIPKIVLKADQEWPTPDVQMSNVRIVFIPNTSAPAFNSFKQAIQEYVAAKYEHPEESWNSSTMMSSIDRIIRAFRLP